ncbi:hypothetical protein PR048_013052 [Dryococelus australis]|uniref:Uncharacterized protein n=1 Tax=Dryococelus australis TaxID=614101 RepID=A0ABQ9HRT1_9NEOP|nr:hypothetical protein PR048_013052 [Dryococelus australis]
MVVLNEAIKIINYIKTRPLKNRFFKICEVIISPSCCTLKLRGKEPTYLMELYAEVATFLMEHNTLLATILNDEDWCANWHIWTTFLTN